MPLYSFIIHKLYLVFEFVERNMLQILQENPEGLPKQVCIKCDANSQDVLWYTRQLLIAISWCHEVGFC